MQHRLRHRVNVQQRVETQDSTTGEITVEWQNVYANVPAEVLTGPGKEFYQSGARQAETTARMTLRWFPGLTQKMRLVWDGKNYNILSIETDTTGRRDYRLRCSEGVNEG